ncbi:hypothetical protein HMPREF9401_0911 [Aliarcobacter butzleri JV22]|nr:hypothetical protein HMPREF9401_0911 [Aliarcobacter butzleri JV22]
MYFIKIKKFLLKIFQFVIKNDLIKLSSNISTNKKMIQKII